MTNTYHKKYENKLLITILDKYIADNGDQLVALEAYKFSSTDPSLFKATSQITTGKLQGAQNSDGRYLANLKELGFITYKNTNSPYQFKLTKSGYLKAKELSSPFRTFIKNHVLASFAALIILVASLINLVAAIIRSIY